MTTVAETRKGLSAGWLFLLAGLCGVAEMLFWIVRTTAASFGVVTLAGVLAVVFLVHAICLGGPVALLKRFTRGRWHGALVLALTVFLWALFGWHVGLRGGVPWHSFDGFAGSAAAVMVALAVFTICRHRSAKVLAIALGSVCVPLTVASLIRLGYAPIDQGQPENPREGWTFVILVDTLGARHTSLYGYERDTTPNLEAFATEATVFRHAVAPASWTGPSVASLFTSLYPRYHQHTGFTILDEDVRTLAELFRAAGYATAGFSSNAVVSQLSNFDQGFAYFDDLQTRISGFDTAQNTVLIEAVLFRMSRRFRSLFRAQEHRLARHINRRFMTWFDAQRLPGGFIYLHYMDPHSPYAPPPGFKKYGDSRVDRYDGDTAYWDHEFGNLIAYLKEKGVYEDATIVVLADHGEEFYEHGSRGHGHSLYEELIHVPLVVRTAGGRATGWIDQQVSLVDVGPTLLQLAGVAGFPIAEGRSFVPLLAGQEMPERPVFAEMLRQRYPPAVAIVEKPFKLIFRTDSGAAELFDLSADPMEARNVLDSDRERAQSLLERTLGLRVDLHSLTTRTATDAEPDTNPELIENLRALGYVQ